MVSKLIIGIQTIMLGTVLACGAGPEENLPRPEGKACQIEELSDQSYDLGRYPLPFAFSRPTQPSRIIISEGASSEENVFARDLRQNLSAPSNFKLYEGETGRFAEREINLSNVNGMQADLNINGEIQTLEEGIETHYTAEGLVVKTNMIDDIPSGLSSASLEIRSTVNPEVVFDSEASETYAQHSLVLGNACNPSQEHCACAQEKDKGYLAGKSQNGKTALFALGNLDTVSNVLLNYRDHKLGGTYAVEINNSEITIKE